MSVTYMAVMSLGSPGCCTKPKIWVTVENQSGSSGLLSKKICALGPVCSGRFMVQK